jgi:hypothetical protein
MPLRQVCGTGVGVGSAAGGTIISGLHFKHTAPRLRGAPEHTAALSSGLVTGESLAMSHRSGISALMFLVAAGELLFLMAELGADVFFVSHNCGSEFNYYGCERPPGQAARVAQKSSS